MISASSRRNAGILIPLFVSFAVLATSGRAYVPAGDPPSVPEPPRTYLDTTYALPAGGTVFNVASAVTLQTTLDAAQPGDVIVLTAGVTYTGHFTLRNQAGAGWIYVISSALASLPAPGTRVTPASASLMPKIVTPDTVPAIRTDPGAHHYRFVGIEFATSWASTSATNFGVVTLGTDNAANADDQPHHITLDRCYVHGTPTGNNRRGLTMNSGSTAVIDSYFEEFHETIADSQAVVSWNGAGPFKLVNNYFSAAGEDVMFGGADPSIVGLVPSDIEIRSNFFTKSLQWKADDPSYAGRQWVVKNLLEFKNAQRVVVQGNVFENSWEANQRGFAVLITPRNQSGTAPWSIVQDVGLHQNIIRRAGAGINLLGTDDEAQSQRATRVLIRDNLLIDLMEDGWGPGWGFGISLTAHVGLAVGVDYVTIDHNTVLPDQVLAFADSGESGERQDHFVFTNNLTKTPFLGSGVNGFGNVLNIFFDAPVLSTNALIGVLPSDLTGYSGNFFSPSIASVGFVDAAAGNYALAPGSPYKNAGSDGRDLGADIESLNAAVACALTGTCSVTAPLIGGVQAIDKTFNTATIVWTTNQPADSQVEYGPTTAYGSATLVDATQELSHAQAVTGLAAGTTYHYRVKSRNSGGLTISPDATFTTSFPPPIASGLSASAVTSSSATIGWTTDQASDSQVEYGPTTDYGSLTPLDTPLVTLHAVPLVGLAHSTTYHYRVKSRNGDGITGTSADATFTTQPVPVISSLTISNIQGASVAVTWQTNQAADTQVEYGLTTAYGSLTPLNTTMSTGHGQALSGLNPGTLYHLRARSRNAIGNLGLSDDTTFMTAPAPVISAVGTSSVTGTTAMVTWTTDLPSNTKIEYGTTPSLGLQTTLDPAMVTAHSQTLTGLTPGVTYYFLVRSITAQNALSKLGGFSFATMLPPVIDGIGATVASTTATINWTTNQSADSQIEYGLTTAYGSSSALDSTLVMAHAQGLSGLTPQTTYHYRVKSRNGGGLTTSGDFTFTTLEPVPVISNVVATPTSPTSVTVTWTTDLLSNSVVFYGPTSAYGALTIGPGPDTTVHTVAVTTDLLPGTTYHFRVQSTNGGGASLSTDGTFTTLDPAPVISGVNASSVTTTSATIGWTTDRASDSQVEYGLTTAYGNSTALVPAAVTSHGQLLAELLPATTYHYRVTSATNGGSTSSGDFTFTTLEPVPVISNVLASAIATTSATISWTTDRAADSQIEYGTTTAYGSTTSLDATPVTAHLQSLSGLSAATTYHYRVRSATTGGVATSGDFTFTTDDPAPVLSNIQASAIGTGTATIGWTTNVASTSQVDYGLTTAYGSTTVLDPALVTTHSQALSSLAAGTTYHYRVVSTTEGGTTTSGDLTFTTLDPAPVVTNVLASSMAVTSASIGWDTNRLADSQIEYGLTTAYGNSTALDATPVITHSQSLIGLTGGTTYHFRVTSSTNGGTTTSGDFTFTTLDPAPALSNIASSGITANSATITWSTDFASDSQIEYGTTTAYGNTTTLDGALVNAHSQSLTSLASGTIYHFRVKSRTAGGLSVSADQTFTTTALPSVISDVAASSITNSTAVIGWTTDQATDTQVEYGPTTAYGSTTTLNPSLVTSHSQPLSGLTLGTTYQYRVLSRNAAGILTQSPNFSFTTTTVPVVMSVTVSNIQGASVAVTWQTDQAADTQIEYGLTTAYGTMTPLIATLSTGHGQAVNSGLNPGTTYHFRIRARNAAGLLGTSDDLTFATAPAPVITDVATANVAGTSVVVTWTTDLPSNSRIEFGTTLSYGQQTTLDPALVTSHSHTIGGLTPGTTYFFLIRSTTAQNALTKLGGFSFTTLTPPVISNVSATAVTGSTATINWTTTPAADSQVEYGLTTAYGNATSVDPAPVTAHGLGLTGLAPLTTYHYRVRSQNGAGTTTSADFTFTTIGAAPVIGNVAASAITPTSATIGWTTDRPADTQVEYGLTTAYGSTTVLDPALVMTHAQVLGSLTPATTYHYRVRSSGPGGASVSGDATFQTFNLPPVTSNVAVTNLNATSVTIVWTTDQASTTQVEFGPTTAYGNATSLNTALITSHSQLLSGLTASTTYHYRVLSRNADGQVGTSADGVFTTQPLSSISNVTISNIQGASAAVTWQTDQPADTQIEYGLTTNYGSMTALIATLSTGHGQAISGLNVGTAYHLRVRSRNAGGDLALSGDFTFTTASAPVITNVGTTNVTGTSVVVTWTTDLPSNSKIEYGTTLSYGQQTTLDPALVTSHSHTISGLNPGTTYFFLIRSTTAQNALTKLGGFSVTTLTPPAIAGVNATGVTGSTASINWTTNQVADSQVEYGITTAYGSLTVVDPTQVTAHTVSLSGLDPLTTYHYRVRSQNGAGPTTSADFTFTTTGAAPLISNVTTSGLTPTSATIGWTTDRTADTQVEYGLTTAYGSMTVLDSTPVLTHAQMLSGLTPATTYHYRVRSSNAGGPTVSGDATFRTLNPPPVISNVAVSNLAATSATIGWLTDQASTTQIEYGLTTGYGSTTTLNSGLVTSHGQSLSSLAAGTTYHYRVLSRNADGVTGMSVDGVFTTQPLPIISNVTISNITGNTAAVTWLTDQATDTQIEYGTTTNYGSMTPLIATLATGHGQAISGLNVGTTYHIRVRSRNAAGDLSVSANFTFTTAAAPVISNVVVAQLTPTSAVVTWTTDLPTNSKIEYGTTLSYGQQTTLDPALVTSHSHTISGLTPGTTYFFLVRATTAQNALTKVGGFTLTTPPQ